MDFMSFRWASLSVEVLHMSLALPLCVCVSLMCLACLSMLCRFLASSVPLCSSAYMYACKTVYISYLVLLLVAILSLLLLTFLLLFSLLLLPVCRYTYVHRHACPRVLGTSLSLSNPCTPMPGSTEPARGWPPPQYLPGWTNTDESLATLSSSL